MMLILYNIAIKKWVLRTGIYCEKELLLILLLFMWRNSSTAPGFQRSMVAPPPMACTGPSESVITYSVLPSGENATSLYRSCAWNSSIRSEERRVGKECI